MSQAKATTIDHTEFLSLGGVRQRISIRGLDRDSDLLLFIHGGPGMPLAPFSYVFRNELERHFIVVHWDQRGAGASEGIDTLRHASLDQFVQDAVELIEELRARYPRAKVHVVGYSWGSVLGLLAVQRRPDLIDAYIGMGQIVHKQRQEEEAYDFTVTQARQRGNRRAQRELAKLRSHANDVEQFLVQRRWAARFGGLFYKSRGAKTALLLMRSPDYSVRDKLRLLLRAKRSLRDTFGLLSSVDFLLSARKLEVPVLFLIGAADHVTPSSLVEEYYQSLVAPRKGLVRFDKSGHAPCWEEPGRFQRTLIEHFATAR